MILLLTTAIHLNLGPKSRTGTRLANLGPEWEKEPKKEQYLGPKVRGRDWKFQKLERKLGRSRTVEGALMSYAYVVYCILPYQQGSL